MKKVIKSNQSYSQAVIFNGTAYISGQMSIDSETGEAIHGTVAEQTKNAMDNLKSVVEKDLQSGMENVLMVNVYISGTEIFPEVDRVYRTYFKQAPPARVTVAVKELYDKLHVEISAVVAV